MRIAEFFHSIQGEGRFTGTPSLFVRTSGCNLRCWFCDTPYTSWHPEGEHETVDRLVEKVLQYDCEHVVVTGGEPMLQPGVVPLTRALSAAGRLVTIETAGTVDRPVEARLMSISPKLANSTPRDDRVWKQRHEARRENPTVMNRLLADYEYQLKFVVDDPRDLEEIDAYVGRFPQLTADRVFLMPQARSPDELKQKSSWLQPAAAARGWRLSPRLHIELFGNVRGK